MNIAHALFVPQGRIGKSGFLLTAALLIVIGIGLSLLQQLAPVLTPLGFFLGIVANYCWVALWIKRLHDAGLTGWLTIPIVLVWLIATSVASFAVMGSAGLDFAMFAGGDPAAVEAEMEAIMARALWPLIGVSTAISAVVVFGLNAILKSDPEENRFGAPAK